jgi:hypothetical protein
MVSENPGSEFVSDLDEKHGMEQHHLTQHVLSERINKQFSIEEHLIRVQTFFFKGFQVDLSIEDKFLHGFFVPFAIGENFLVLVGGK